MGDVFDSWRTGSQSDNHVLMAKVQDSDDPIT